MQIGKYVTPDAMPEVDDTTNEMGFYIEALTLLRQRQLYSQSHEEGPRDFFKLPAQ